MSAPVVLGLWLLLSGALALVAMGWAALAAFAEDAARGLAWALLVLTALMAAWPAVLTRWTEGASPYGLPLFLGMTLILAAALVCLDRLRRRPEARLPARLGIGAALNFWLALSVAVLLPA